LTAAILGLRMVQAQAASTAPDLAERLDPIGGELQRAVDEIRELARGVRPAALDSGLSAAVHDLAERAALPVTVDSGLDRRLPDDVETVAYFVVSEALTNATRHAGASHVTVSLRDGGSSVRVVVTDDGSGVGFDVAAGQRPARHGTGGTGLVGLFDRLDAVGGTLDVRRTGSTGGTIVEAVLPCGS
jgi:signal transduction histidine kinase